MATLKFVQAPTAAIALPMGDSDTEFYGLDIKDINGNYLSMSDFGTIGYMTINPTSPYAEIVSFTGCVYQGDGTTLFTGVTRGLLAIDPYTTGGTPYAHSPNDSLVFSINPQMLDAFVQKGQDATITGTFTFLYTKMPRASQTVTYGVGSDLWLTTKEYVDGVAIAGAPNASTSTKGIGRVSVPPVDANIPIFVGDNDDRVPTVNMSSVDADMVAAIVAGNAPTALNPFITLADGATTSTPNRFVKTNGSGKIDTSFIYPYFLDDGVYTTAEALTIGEVLTISPYAQADGGIKRDTEQGNFTQTFSVTIGNNSNRILIVDTIDGGGGTISAVTAGGVAMSAIQTVGTSPGYFKRWFLAAPTVGSINIVITGTSFYCAVTRSFYNCSQSAPTQFSSGNSVSGGTVSPTALTPASNCSMILVTGFSGAMLGSSGTATIDTYSVNNITSISGAYCYASAWSGVKWVASSMTPLVTFASGSGTWSMGAIACVIEPATAPAAGLLKASAASGINGVGSLANWVGFSTGTFAIGAVNARMYTMGSLPLFSGLTAGTPYYLSNTPGALSTSAGTTSKKIGVAISTTTLVTNAS